MENKPKPTPADAPPEVAKLPLGDARPALAEVGWLKPAANLPYLRGIADVDALRQHFQPGTRLAIVGGGYIGLEVAAVAVKHGLKVTVIEAADRVMVRVRAT